MQFPNPTSRALLFKCYSEVVFTPGLNGWTSFFFEFDSLSFHTCWINIRPRPQYPEPVFFKHQDQSNHV